MPAPFCVRCSLNRMAEAVIVAAARTPIGRARKGSLVDVRPDDLAAFAIRSAVDQVPELDGSEIVDVMVGCGFPEQRQGMNVARRAALLADLPPSAAGTTVNRFCASSLQTIRMAFHAIRAGRGRRLRRRRRRVDLPGQRLPEGRRGAASPADRLGRRDRQRLHPDGDDGGERRRALRRRAGGDGPLRPALAGAGRGGAGVGALRPRDHALHEGGRHRRLPGRRPAARVDARGARRARARFPRRTGR